MMDFNRKSVDYSWISVKLKTVRTNLSGEKLHGKFINLTALMLSKSSGPGCSKLTTLLVNETLKFQTLIKYLKHANIFC